MRISRYVPVKSIKGKSDRRYHQIFNREGLFRTAPKHSTISELHQASIDLFRFILEPKDPRWRLAYLYTHLRKERAFDPINLENALLAKYASHTHSGRGRYARYISEENTTHLARAMNNIALGRSLLPKNHMIQIPGTNYSAQFERTKSISRGKDKRGVTGCPEALWQLQLYEGDTYLGRIGFNFHHEGRTPILTISNIQGAEGRRENLVRFNESQGAVFSEYLIHQLKHTLKSRVHYRGIKQNEKNPTLYAMAFRKTKTTVY